MTSSQEHATWAELLYSAVHTPGKLLAAYTAFHNFSFANALRALEQCLDRNIEPGPLNNYKGWQALKRQVRRGEKGLSLCMPVTYKEHITDTTEPDKSGESEQAIGRRFVFRSYWFVLGQTEGEATCDQAVPGFDLDTALEALKITRTPFDEMNGNIQGVARRREIAVSPVAALPFKTTFHEMAHVIEEDFLAGRADHRGGLHACDHRPLRHTLGPVAQGFRDSAEAILVMKRGFNSSIAAAV